MKKLSKEDIYKITIVSFIFLIITLIALYTINEKKKILEEPLPNIDAYSVVTNYNTFFFVNKNIETFINYISTNNTNAVLNFLDETENLNNISSNLRLVEKDISYMAKITKSYTVSDNIILYYTEGNISKEGFDGTINLKNNIKFLLFVDYNTMSCSIKLINKEITEEELKLIPKEKKINPNSDNQLKQVDIIDTTRVCSIYLSDFIKKLDNKDTYKIVNNFASYEEFKNFVDNSYLTSEIKSCNQNISEDGKRIYNIVDKNNYRYVLIENNIFDYTISIAK